MKITEHHFTTPVEDGWLDCCGASGGSGEGQFTIEQRPGAPRSPPNVARVSYPDAFAASPTHRHRGLPVGLKEIYLSFWVRHSNSWTPGGFDQIGRLRVGGKPHVSFGLQSDGKGGVLPAVFVGNILLQPLTALLMPTNTSAPALTMGVWHRWEVRFEMNTENSLDARVAWWIDGVKYGDHTGFGFRGADAELDFEGVGWIAGYTHPLASARWMEIDHLYVSAPPKLDQITLQNNVTGGPTALLVDGWASIGATPVCENDLLLVGAGTVPVAKSGLNVDVRTAPPNCEPELAAFSRSNGMLYHVGAANLAWSDGFGDDVPAPLPAPPLEVPVVFWRYGEPCGGTLPSPLLLSFDFSKKRLDLLGTGLEVEEAAANTPVVDCIPTPYTNDPADFDFCDEVQLAYSNGDFEPESLNVYLVALVDGGAATGYACYSYGAPNVVFISKQMAYDTFLHELGHALGLQAPWWGHTDQIDGMGLDNVMAPTPGDEMDPSTGAPITSQHLTLGQAFRMNASTASWLNETRPSGTSARGAWANTVGTTANTKPCQCDPHATDAECPTLWKDRVSPSSPITSSPDPTCMITLDKPSVTLTCPQLEKVTASFFYTSVTQPTNAAPLWISDDPTVAQIHNWAWVPSTNMYSAELKGVGNGTTTVSVNAGGPEASVAVTVQGCP